MKNQYLFSFTTTKTIASSLFGALTTKILDPITITTPHGNNRRKNLKRRNSIASTTNGQTIMCSVAQEAIAAEWSTLIHVSIYKACSTKTIFLFNVSRREVADDFKLVCKSSSLLLISGEGINERKYKLLSKDFTLPGWKCLLEDLEKSIGVLYTKPVSEVVDEEPEPEVVDESPRTGGGNRRGGGNNRGGGNRWGTE